MRIKIYKLLLPNDNIAHIKMQRRSYRSDTFADISYLYVPGLQPISGEVYILVHGSFSYSDATWELALPPIISAARHVYMLDLPGNGKTATDSLITHDTVDNAHVIERLMHYLTEFAIRVAAENNWRRSILVGHSFGGYLAAYAAKQRPDLYRTLIMIAPCGIFPFGDANSYNIARLFGAQLFIKCLYCVSRMRRMIIGPTNDFVDVMGSSDIHSLYVKRIFRVNDAATECWYTMPAINQLIYLRNVAVVFIHGANDELVSPLYMQFLRIMRYNGAHYHILPGETHYLSRAFGTQIAQSATSSPNMILMSDNDRRLAAMINWSSPLWHTPCDPAQYNSAKARCIQMLRRAMNSPGATDVD
jgi:pimeloyl-ACP methyl ester carboxylesterase